VTRADLSRLASFLEELREATIHFTVRSVRPQAIMVNVNVPGERWEVEFLDDGSSKWRGSSQLVPLRRQLHCPTCSSASRISATARRIPAVNREGGHSRTLL